MTCIQFDITIVNPVSLAGYRFHFPVAGVRISNLASRQGPKTGKNPFLQTTLSWPLVVRTKFHLLVSLCLQAHATYLGYGVEGQSWSGRLLLYYPYRLKTAALVRRNALHTVDCAMWVNFPAFIFPWPEPGPIICQQPRWVSPLIIPVQYFTAISDYLPFCLHGLLIAYHSLLCFPSFWYHSLHSMSKWAQEHYVFSAILGDGHCIMSKIGGWVYFIVRLFTVIPYTTFSKQKKAI